MQIKMKIKLIYLGALISLGTMAQSENTAVIDATNTNVSRISRFIYSHFSEHLGHCIYEGLWVGEESQIPNKNGIRTDVVEALNKIQIPALRWPGGCFADEYHWKDGTGPRKDRPKMINTNWGGVTEDNSFGTHEFMELCELLNCEAYISGNLGSGTVQEMSQWVEYLNSDNESPMTELRKTNRRKDSWGVKYWGVGNESWGCGGQMKPEYYVNLARHYSTFLKNYGDNNLNLIAVGPNSDDYNWTEVTMREMGNNFWGLALHYYTSLNSSATNFEEDEWFDVMDKTLKMEEIINNHSAIMDKYDPNKRVALVVDEWGTWYEVEPGTNPGFLYQQNSLRDALVAGINLNIFNNHCDRVRMTAIAQMVNVLQSVILTKDEKMVLTPTYHVFDLYKVHQDAYLLPATLQTIDYEFEGKSVPALNISSSIDKNGMIHISICNLDAHNPQKLKCDIKGYTVKSGSAQIVTADKLSAYNSFDNPNVVGKAAFSDFKIEGNKLGVNMPPHSVVMITLEGDLKVVDNSIKLKNALPGLKYDFFEGNFYKLDDFREFKPKSSGVIESIEFPAESKGFNFGVNYTGYLNIDESAMYSFEMASDDGSLLKINDKIVIDLDGRHGVIKREGIVFLHKGYHKFDLSYFQAGGGAVLKIKIVGKEGDPLEIHSDMFFHVK